MPFIWDFWRPITTDRRGTMLSCESVAVGTGGIAVTASATTSVIVPLPKRRLTLKSFTIVGTVAAAGAGAITAQVFKVSTGGGSQAVTGAVSLTNSTITAAGAFSFPFSAALADGLRLIDGTKSTADYVRIDLVAASTVTTQPTASIVLEFGFCD